MSVIKKYLSLVKFSHTIFAMPFALIGFSLGVYALRHNDLLTNINYDFFTNFPVEAFKNYSAQNEIWIKLALVVLCMIFARSAAMAFNRWLDARYDALNPRTAIREIPSGTIKSSNALFFVFACSVLFVLCCFFINTACFILSPVALFIILFYSYTKRFTALCHLVLGAGLSLAPIGAYLAVAGSFSLLPILFSFAVLFWVSGFDIIYALQDEEFDKTQKLHSIPAAVGKSKALFISTLLHLLSAACVMYAGVYGHFGWLYWIGVCIFVGMLIYQHAIVKPTDLRRVNIAFMTANGIASVVFAVFVIADIFLR
jgi:4-hydroxybenzoate polyprenyltransferase